jgi:hypothetical protein
VKPLITVTLSFESYVTYMMNPNLGNPPKIQSQKDDTLVMAQTKSTRMLGLLVIQTVIHLQQVKIQAQNIKVTKTMN